MNTANTITSEQINAIFRYHNLAQNPSIARLTTGFTNEVYAVAEYILKICVNTNNEAQFCRETYLYELLRGQVAAPDPIVADTSKSIIDRFYMVYRRIEGEPVGRRWHILQHSQRKQLIADLCVALRHIDSFPIVDYARRFGLNPNLVWEDDTVTGLFKALAIVRDRGILSAITQQAIEKYINETRHVLRAQKLGLVFWDVQFDNVLIDNKNQFTTLIDFEGVSITSIDYRLVFVRVMSERPYLFMSEEMEPYAVAEDYTCLMEWYREFYPELFDFPDMEKRLDLYELGDILAHLPDWPKAQQNHDRLARILG